MDKFKNPVYCTCQRRFINQVNAVDCSQHRIHLTESGSQHPSAWGLVWGNTRRARSRIPSSQVSLSQVGTSSLRSIKSMFCWGKNRARPPDLYLSPIYVAWGLHNRHTSRNYGPRIVTGVHRILTIRTVASSSLWYLTQLATYIAW